MYLHHSPGFQLWVSQTVSFMASLATRPAPTTKSSARAILGSETGDSPEITGPTCVGNWVIQKKAVEQLKSWICVLRWLVNQRISWKYLILMEIQAFNLQKVILGRSCKKHISIIIGMQVKRSHKFHWPAALRNCQGTSEAWTAPVPCAPPGCPARHSCGKSPWEVVFVGKFTQLLREIDGIRWLHWSKWSWIRSQLLQYPSISELVDAALVETLKPAVLTLVVVSTCFNQVWAKNWTLNQWRILHQFLHREYFLLHPTRAPTLGNPLLFGSPASIPWAPRLLASSPIRVFPRPDSHWKFKFKFEFPP